MKVLAEKAEDFPIAVAPFLKEHEIKMELYPSRNLKNRVRKKHPVFYG